MKAHKIQKEIQRLNKELREHQKKCKHTKGTKIPKSNTGNWCSSDDSYWYDCYCPTCLKFWCIDSTQDEYIDCKLKTVQKHNRVVYDKKKNN